MDKTKRITELDFFKGLAIVLVVVGHVISKNWEGALDSHPVYTWIYSFHMPLFFFVSGYLMSYSNRGLSTESFRKKTLALLLPYIIWSFVLGPLFSDNRIYFNPEEFLNPNGKYWFIYLLWFYSMIYYCCNSIYKMSAFGGGILLTLIAVSIGVAQYFYPCELFSRGLQFLPMYIYGAAAKKFNLQDRKWIENSIVLSLLFVLFMITSLSYMRMDYAAYNKLMKLIASASINTIILYYVKIQSITGVEGKRKYLTLPIIYAGKNSIVIYITHILFWRVLPNPVNCLNILQPFWAFILALFISIIISSACLLIGKIVERFIWINRLVYGRGW